MRDMATDMQAALELPVSSQLDEYHFIEQEPDEVQWLTD